MDSVEIRPFRSDDAPRVHELGARLTEGVAPWRSPERVSSTINEWIGTAITKADDDTHLLLVADDSDHGVVGFIAANVQQHYISGVDGYIGELAVSESHARRGIGKTLIDEATTWAKASGCERMTLQTGAANSGAIAFYESLGFVHEDVALAREI